MSPRPVAPLGLERREGETWFVSSGQQVYRVLPNRLTCECAAGRRHRLCRHVRFVLDLLETGARPPAA